MNKEIAKLEDKKWKEFKIYDIFSPQRGKRQIESNRKNGNIPYFSASQNNNGLTDFISNPIFQIDRNAIIYSTFGDAYYVEKTFTTSDEITILTKKHLNKYNGLFLSNAINQNKSKYSFGRKAFSNKISKDKIMLPINDNLDPDYKYMEEYTKLVTKNKLEKYISYAKKQLKKTQYKKIEKLENKEWKEVQLNSLFKVYTGTDLIISKIKEGNIPIVSHSISNNGVSTYSNIIENRKLFNNKTTISLADRGNFFAFVQKEHFYIGTRVKALEAKFEKVNCYILKFICQLINNQAVRFSYGNNATSKTESIKIIVPITHKGEPDYDYMEQYIKNIIYKKLNNYLNYKRLTKK